MKKITALLLTASVIFALTACGRSGTDSGRIPDRVSTEKGRYEIAFVTDVGQLLDKSFNQAVWEGIKGFAYETGRSYRYFQPANGSQASDTDRYNAITAAVNSGAETVVVAGFLHIEALGRAAKEHPEVKFIFVDGILPEADGAPPPDNIAAITYCEEEAGFLAGYAAVAEGYTRLGFSGGGSGINGSVNRYAYGFARGAELAAERLGKEIELIISWEYGSTYSPSAELQTMLSGWYANGTEVVFSCGGLMCQSAFAAASANGGAVIGCDVDRSAESETVIASAVKGLRESVILALERLYGGSWDEIGGKLTTFGVKEGGAGLSTDNWRMKSFTPEAYRELLAELESGEITVDGDYERLTDESFGRVKIIIR